MEKVNALDLFRKVYSLSKRLFGDKADEELDVLFEETLNKMATEKQMLLRIDLEISILKIEEFMALIGKDKLNKLHAKKLLPVKQKSFTQISASKESVATKAVCVKQEQTKPEMTIDKELPHVPAASPLPSTELVTNEKKEAPEPEIPVRKPHTNDELWGGHFPAITTDDEGSIVKNGYTVHRHVGTRY